MNRDRINLILKNCDKERTLVNKELDKVKPNVYKQEIILALVVGFAVGFFASGIEIDVLRLIQDYVYGNI